METLTAEAVELTGHLVQLPSESAAPTASDRCRPEGRVAAAIGAYCDGAGLAWHYQPVSGERANIVVRRPQPGAPRVVLAAHMDTVSAAGMTAPFAGTLEGGRIHGRGACDDKGSLAVALAVLARVSDPRFDVTLVATVDEECSLAGAETAAQTLEPFDLCIGMEPTRCRPVVAHKGVARLAVHTRGRAAHASMPAAGRNAVSGMVPVIIDLERYGARLAERDDPLLGPPTLAVTMIHGGRVANMVPDHCTATVDIRFLPEEEASAVVEAVREVVGERGEVEVLFQADGLRTDPERGLVAAFIDEVAAAGGPAGWGGVSYATDCARLQARGPCLVWGPGDIAQAHQAEEWIAVAEIDLACRILYGFLAGPHR